MTDNERAITGIGLLFFAFAMVASTLYIALGEIELAFWWSLALSTMASVGVLLVVRADRRATRDRTPEAKPDASAETIGPIDTWIVLGVPCAPEIYDEMTKAVAEGWRLAQVTGRPEDPRISVEGPHGYCTSLEKPSEL